MIFYLVYVTLICLVSLSVADVYSSMEDLKNLVMHEKKMTVELRDYIEAEEGRLAKLRSLTQEYEQHSEEASSNPEHFVSNPINSYLLIKKLSLDWNNRVINLLESPETREARHRISSVEDNFPGYEDLEGAAAGILRLQDTYKLDPGKIALGDFAGVKSAKLTAEDCFEIGRYAYNHNDSYHCSIWMHATLAREVTEVNKTVDRATVLDYLAFTESLQGNTKYALKLTNELLELAPTHQRAISNKKYYEAALLQGASGPQNDDDETPMSGERPLDNYRRSDEYSNYEALCRDEEVYSNPHRDILTCRYATNNHPLLILKPAKIEEVYHKPYIMLIHDVMSEAELDSVKALGSPKLNRATVHNTATGKLETAFYRVSKSGWLKIEDDPLVSRLRNRFAAISRMSFATAEDIQVANYGVGGQYEPHYDFARKRENAFQDYAQGNRIATWMTYMSDVEKGGATVFTNIGVKVFPKRGKAVFWYNLHKNGEGIAQTRHAACPVLVGSKWVSNIWLHESGNEFTRPCSLNPDE